MYYTYEISDCYRFVEPDTTLLSLLPSCSGPGLEFHIFFFFFFASAIDFQVSWDSATQSTGEHKGMVLLAVSCRVGRFYYVSGSPWNERRVAHTTVG